MWDFGVRSQFSCWFRKDYRQRVCRLGTVKECSCAVWEEHCRLFPVTPPLHLFSSWAGMMTPRCHHCTLGLPSPSCQSAGMTNSHPHGAPRVSPCSSVVNHCCICHMQPGWRAFSRNWRRSAKALHCCQSPWADKTHPDCTLLHPRHCIPAWELINRPRNLLGLALGITEWVRVFQTVNPYILLFEKFIFLRVVWHCECISRISIGQSEYLLHKRKRVDSFLSNKKTTCFKRKKKISFRDLKIIHWGNKEKPRFMKVLCL